MKRKIIIIISVLIAVCAYSNIAIANASSTTSTDFSGTRKVEYKIDQSDLENFVDGGRPAFDLILRDCAPEWMNYTLSSSGRDATLAVDFTFESYNDYVEKVSALLTYSPSIVYSNDHYLLLLEGHSSLELLNFLESALSFRDCLSEVALSELFRCVSNEICLNGSVFQTGDRINIREAASTIVRPDYLELLTTGHDDGSYVREVRMRVDTSAADEDSIEEFEAQLEMVGEVHVEELSGQVVEYSLEFTALDENDLARKTMLCLNIAVSITNIYKYIDDATVEIERKEFIDFDGLMRDGAAYHYSFLFPSYVSCITSEDKNISVSDNIISTSSVSEIVCRYESPPAFSSVDVVTDFSNPFGRIQRNVTFALPSQLAPFFHENIKAEFEKLLIRGATLDIYDEGESRNYKFSYSSFFLNDVTKFSKIVFDGNRDLTRSDSWVPHGQSYINDYIELNTNFKEMAPPINAQFTYKLPDLSLSIRNPVPAENASVADNQISFSVRDGYRISFEYRCINALKLFVELVAILAILITTVIIWTNLLSKRKGK